MPEITRSTDRLGPVLKVDSLEAPLHTVPDARPSALEPKENCNVIGAVVRALREIGHPALRSIEIEISGGVVILWGRVPSYSLKQLAQETAQRVAGVQGIANGLEVVCCR
jgi:hypothetical protein